MRRSVVVLATLAVLALVSPARADDPKLEVTCTPKKAEVVLGEPIELEVVVKNVGKEAAELVELTFDKQSVWLELSLGGKTFKDQQIHDGVEEPKKYEKKKLEAGAEWKKTFFFPTVVAAELEVTAVYSGTGKDLGSEPKKVKVTATKEGATEVCAKMRTNLGPITLKFFPNEALGTIHNFVRLAKDGFYDGRQFHRVVKSDSMGVVQGGCPKGNGSGGPGYTIPAEFNEQKHTVGRISMARRQSVDSGGSQFFLVTKDTSHLDRNYTVFGEIVKGLDVIAAMGDVPCNGETPREKLALEAVKIEALPKD